MYPPSPMSQSDLLYQIYTRLQEEYGPQHWWPADTPFEVMLGAILTQNTAWTNVEKAMASLRGVCGLTPEGILSLTPDRLENAIRSSGYFRQKSARLRSFCRFLMNQYGGDLSGMGGYDTGELREELLSLKGIGPETADSILLYALDRPVFVVDAYTIRILSRLGLVGESIRYDEVQALLMENIEPEIALFNEFHALFVAHGKNRCTKRSPKCLGCPVSDICPAYSGTG